MAAVRHEAEHRGILARELHEILAARQPLLGHARHVGGCILDADHVLQLAAARQRRHRDIDDGARGHVVDEDRQVDSVADRLEVPVEAFLGRLVVVAGRMQGGVGAGLLGKAGEVDRLVGRVGARAGDHRHALPGGFDAQLDDALVLVVAQGGAFAGRADRHQPMRALRDLPLHKLLERPLVDCAALERRYQRRIRTPEHGLLPIIRLSTNTARRSVPS